ncbi:DMT family transporter [Acinetobacter wuhouensis]|uniref:DMT family transporter n=1 Tax=Acinetobacter wuhouensis TaxID=1879050 RepID=A0A4Q7ALK5_9GAMM|nr:DMT family transporter [Acinetobacter wuhouensis]RZG48363.1 DMT family transporter [Acinetobacter wuhouensis]RZG74552.1 DMT family transporter [Acinetobacter wuhouensis]
MNVLLYFSVVIIWGTTWIAIKLQHGQFSPVIGVFWRFLIAAMIIFIGLLLTKKLKALNLWDHLFCALQGLCIFGFNFICFYSAVAYINSGLESVIFSMAILFNAFNNKLFFQQKISFYFIPASILGLAGIVALFWHDLFTAHLNSKILLGIGLCMLGTYGFSLGNMISIRHQKRGLDVLSTNAYGMLYGSVTMLLIGLITQQDFFPTITLQGLFALGYLSIFGTIIGFTLYFILIGRIGAGKAAYSTLLFPLVALSISTIWENYHWYTLSCIGVFLILFGNYILFAQPKWLSKLISHQGESRKV